MKHSKKIFTIPNAMSAFRIILIPVFVWLYHARALYIPALVVLLLSCLTDLADGWVARHFNMVSDLGKMLDPIADKLTQGIVLICLIWEFPILIIPLIVLIIKECVTAVTNLLVIQKSGEVHGAELHGKITTWLLDFLLFIHVLWHGIPFWFSAVLVILCVLSMVMSMVLYCEQNIRYLRQGRIPENKQAR